MVMSIILLCTNNSWEVFVLDNESLEIFNQFSKNLKSKKEYYRVVKDLYDYSNNISLLEITPKLVDGFIKELNNNNNTKRRKYHQLLSFYNYLFDRMLIEKNPVREVPVPKASKQINIDRTISTENVLKLLEHLRDNYSRRDYVITLLIATTGMKLSEVRTLRWGDFFVDSNENIGIEIKDNTSNRYIRIFDFVWKEIDLLRQDLGLDQSYLKSNSLMFFASSKNKNYLYNPSEVRPISIGWIKKVHTKACDELEIPLVTSKDLRHYYTMLCIKLGFPSNSIKKQLGWSSSQFMYRYNGVIEVLASPLNNMVNEFFKENMK